MQIVTISLVNNISIETVFVFENRLNAYSGVSSYNRFAACNFAAINETINVTCNT